MELFYRACPTPFRNHDGDRLVDQFDLLDNARLDFRVEQSAAASRARVECVVACGVKLVGRKGCSFVFEMSGLTADFAFFALERFGFWFDDIAGGWLGGVGGILFEPRVFRFELHDACFELQ